MIRNRKKHQPHENSTKTGIPSGVNGNLADEKDSALLSTPEETPASDPAVEQTATIQKLQDQLLRFQADFDNFRKRTLREKNEIFDMATSELMQELLPVLDHLQLGIQAAVDHKADPAMQEGLQLIFDQLMGVLMKFGLIPIDAEQQVFDPARFEAISHMASDKEPEGRVLAQTRRGYMLRNKLLRPAQVVVSSGPAGEKSQAAEEAETSSAEMSAEEEE